MCSLHALADDTLERAIVSAEMIHCASAVLRWHWLAFLSISLVLALPCNFKVEPDDFNLSKLFTDTAPRLLLVCHQRVDR